MLNKLAKSLFGHCHKELGFQMPPRLFLKNDQQNAASTFGKTAYYDPGQKSITIFVTGRHPKDVLRSIAHELIHHHQNERGDLEKCASAAADPGYAQNNKDLRKMEEEAYLRGNMLFRDWEDSCKAKFQMEENKQMKLEDLRKLIQNSITEVMKSREEETVNEMGGAYKRDDEEDTAPEATPLPPSQLDAASTDIGPALPDDPQGLASTAMAAIHKLAVSAGVDMSTTVGTEGEPPPPPSDGIRETAKSLEEESIEDIQLEETSTKKKDDPLEENWGGSSRPKDRGGYGREPHNPGKSDEARCREQARGKHGPEYWRAYNNCMSRSTYSNFEESNVMTPERESALKENYMGSKRNRLFELLKNKWSK